MRAYSHHPVLRWLSVGFRGLHLVSIIGLGAAIMGAPLSIHTQSAGVVLTGVVMFAHDLWNKPRLFFEWSGLALLIKLGMVVLMALNAEMRLPLFWAVVIWSAIFAHAPASFRHATWRR
jgi:hypothetical protein